MFKLVLEKAEEPEIILSTSVGEGDDRGWDGWMALPTRWTWVWVNSGSWWWTGRPGVLQFMESQRVGHDWATELNWTDWIIKKAREFQKKTSISASPNMPKTSTVWIITNCGKYFKRWDYQTTWPVSWEIYMQVKKQQLELDMEQQTGFK